MRRWWTCSLLLLLMLVTRHASAHPPAARPAQPEPSPHFHFDPADETIETAVWESPLWYDADVLPAGDVLWYAWLEFKPGEGDRIWVGSRRDGDWTSQQLVTDRRGDYASPRLTQDVDGQLWLSYEADRDGQWDVMALRLENGLPAGSVQRISPGPGADIHHRAAADPQGGLWIVWQSDRDGQFDLMARHVTDAQLAEPEVVSDQPRGDWQPQLAVEPDGTVHVAWDACDGHSFNVHLRSRRDGRWGSVVDVAHSAAFEGRAQVAVDKQSRVWIAWEEDGENWGKPFRGISTLAISDQVGPVHRFRLLRLAMLDPQGNVRRLRDALPMPSVRLAMDRKETKSGVTKAGAFYERARLTVDEAGRLWVAYRQMYTPWLGVEHQSHVEGGWGVYARHYGTDGWSKLFKFGVGQGDGMQRLEIEPHGRGIAAAWTTGRTDRRTNELPRGIVTAEISAPGMAAREVALLEPSEFSPPPDQEKAEEAPAEAEPVRSADGKYQLFFGDLHRHTDLSLCRVPFDGTIDDAYRYAIDVAGLNFLGITDHSRDIARGDALSLLWWRSRKEVYRHQLGTTFFPFFAYERSHGDTADHNVISLRGDMLRPHTYPVPEFWKELDHHTTITIPHQPIRRETWSYQDDLLRPLLEIFQGCRDASIEEDAHRGLAKGFHIGFIASSDHSSTSASYACVWAEDASRESIFDALKSRRTYGATAKIRLSVRAGDHWMGEQLSGPAMPEVELEATGTAPIRSVTWIVDGKEQDTLSPNERQLSLRKQIELGPGEHYVYAHLLQSDGNRAWSSPIWVTIAGAKPPESAQSTPAPGVAAEPQADPTDNIRVRKQVRPRRSR